MASREGAAARSRLAARFLRATGIIAVTVVIAGAFSAWRFARLGDVVDETLAASQAAIDLTQEAAVALEREDDALLLAISGELEQARRDLEAERRRFDDAWHDLEPRLLAREEQAAAKRFAAEVAIYRRRGDELLRERGVAAREHYHQEVNPALRRAVAAVNEIRELHFTGMKEAGVRARDASRRATRVVLFVTGLALLASVVVALRLARSVVRPIQNLGAAVEAVRRGEFDRRVGMARRDEIGELGEGINRMADALEEFRRSKLGEVLRAKEVLATTLGTLPDAVMVFDAGGALLTANAQARRLLGDEEAPPGPELLEETGLPEEVRGAIRAALEGTGRRPGRFDLGEALSLDLASEERKVLLTALPIQGGGGESLGAVAVFHDVTDFVRLDALRLEHVAIASHELKTPLTTMRMNLLLMREGARALPAKVQEILATAVRGCEELGATVDEFLDLTRIESGNLELEPEPVELVALARETVRSLEERFDDAGIAVEVKGEPAAVTVWADPRRLRIVLTNLLDNGLKYTPRGGRVSVRVTGPSVQNAGSAPAGAAQIAVTDTGHGVPARLREPIFERFFRAVPETHGGRGGPQGAGIGLYLCRKIVEAHGGLIRCRPGDGGRGTTFAFELPALPPGVRSNAKESRTKLVQDTG